MVRERRPGGRRRPSARSGGLGLLLLALACGGASDRTYSVRGVVRAVQPEYGQLVVAHENIPGLMPAMTMNFGVAEPSLLARVEPGQLIEFELEFTGKSYRILDLAVLAESSHAPGAQELSESLVRDDPAPPIELVDQSGRPFRLAQLRGTAVLLDFVYTRCPGPCPILTGAHAELYRTLVPELRARTRLVSVSLDPTHDTPEVLRGYARARGADLPGWFFLTGAASDVAAVIRAYGVGSVRQPGGEIDHRVVTFLIDPRGNIARRFMGLEHEPDEVARAVARVLGSFPVGGSAGKAVPIAKAP